jgi:glc operon protein GlcG
MTTAQTPVGMMLATLMLSAAAPAVAQAPAAPKAAAPVRPPRMPYGQSITLAQAKAVAAAAEAAALKAKVAVSIAVTDTAGELVYFEQIDDTSTGIRELALQKARFSARFRMPTSYVGDMKKIGNDSFLAFPGAFPGPGGITLTAGGRTVGGLGVSGGADGEVAEAGAAVLK